MDAKAQHQRGRGGGLLRSNSRKVLHGAAVTKDNFPFSFRLWHNSFDFVNNWYYLLALTVCVTLLRVLIPQRAEAINSIFSSQKNAGARISFGSFQGVVWILRDAWCQLQWFLAEATMLIRWLAGRSSVIRNRTKLIASSHETLTSYLISIASSTVFFAGAAAFGTALVSTLFLFDYSFHGKVSLSFFPMESDGQEEMNQLELVSSIGALDMCVFSLFFFLSLGTSAEHLSRREVLDEAILRKAEDIFHHQQHSPTNQRGVVTWFRIRKVTSFVMQLLWVVLFNMPKTAPALIVTIRYVSASCVLVLLGIHVLSARVALKFLFGRIDHNAESILKLHIKGTRFLLKWYRKEELQSELQTKSNLRKMFFALQRVIAMLLWHVSGRTFAAQVAMFIMACNWINVVPSVQIALSSFLFFTIGLSLIIWRLMMFMNPECINESGDEIPIEHIGFGMLAIKEQLSGMDPNSRDGNSLKLVPASIERLMEAFTISYRWPAEHTVNVSIWNQSKPRTAYLNLDFLNCTFEHMGRLKPKFGQTLIWLDQVSIDQASDSFKAILVPKMTVCYALSRATVVLDNSYEYPHSEVQNYFRRIWTFQEYCLPPRLILVTLFRTNEEQRVRQDSYNANESRNHIQSKFWSGADGKITARPTNMVAAAVGQEFLIPWLDGDEIIERALTLSPTTLTEYDDAVSDRVGFNSNDRFPALMQAISGVICFKQEDVLSLKRTIVKLMGESPEIFGNVTLIDNVGMDFASVWVGGR